MDAPIEFDEFHEVLVKSNISSVQVWVNISSVDTMTSASEPFHGSPCIIKYLQVQIYILDAYISLYNYTHIAVKPVVNFR